MPKDIGYVQGHYEVQDVEMGKIYTWRPESAVVECDCGEELSLTASENAYCGECGADHRAIIEEALEARPEDEEGVLHPWRSPCPYYAPTRGTSPTRGLRRQGDERAKGTVAWWYERARRLPSIEARALGPMLRAQAPKRGSHSVHPSRRRLRGSLPVV